MPRTLRIDERHVSDADRAEYLAALSARKARASSVPAHFWVFEHATERGRFIEFTEATSEAGIAAVHGLESAGDCWREVQGG